MLHASKAENGGVEGQKFYLTPTLFCASLLDMRITRIEKHCIECTKLFLAPIKELRRGNAKFCSLSCAAKHGNKQNELHQKQFICRQCGVTFLNTQNTSQYCSHRCKQRSANSRRSSKWNKALNLLPCEICGWQRASRDVHHIVPIKDGGSNEITNLITLCPNCHREADRNLISQEQLSKAVNKRTISSSAAVTAELGANAVIKGTKALR